MRGLEVLVLDEADRMLDRLSFRTFAGSCDTSRANGNRLLLATMPRRS